MRGICCQTLPCRAPCEVCSTRGVGRSSKCLQNFPANRVNRGTERFNDLPSKRQHVRPVAQREGPCASLTVSPALCQAVSVLWAPSLLRGLRCSQAALVCPPRSVCACIPATPDPRAEQLGALAAGSQPAWFPSLRVGRWFLSNEAPFQGRLLTCSSIARWSLYLFCSHAPSETLMIPKPL